MAVAIGIVGSLVACTPSAQPEPSPSPSLADGVLTALATSPDGVVAAGQRVSSPNGAALSWCDQSGSTWWSDSLDDLTAFTLVASAPNGDVIAAGLGSYYHSEIAYFDATGALLWKQSFNNVIVKDVTFTPDGNVVAAGATKSGNSNSDAWLLVLSPAGDQLMTRTFGGSADDSFTTVSATSDGSLVAAGDTGSNDGDLSGAKDPSNMVVRFSSDGTTQWVKTFSYLNDMSFASSVALPDGDVVLAGDASILTQNRSMGLLLAVDAQGQTAWAKTYATDDSNSFSGVTATADGGLIAVGNALRKLPTGGLANQGLAVSLDASHGLAWANVSGDTPYTGVAIGGDGVTYVASQTGLLSSLGPDGAPQIIAGTPTPTPSAAPTMPTASSTPSPLWYQSVGGSSNSQFQGVAVLGDGTVAAVGYTNSPAGDFNGNPAPALSDWTEDFRPYASGLVALYDPTGVRQWVKSFPGDNDINLYSVAATPDGGMVAVGVTRSKTGDLRLAKGSDLYDGIVVKLDRQGDIVWAKAIRGTSMATFSAVAVASNGDIFAAGDTNSGSQSSKPIGQAGLITKLTASGQVAWTKTYGERGVSLNTIAVTLDGGLIVGGYTSSKSGSLQMKNKQNSQDALVAKVAASGAIAWHQVYGTDDYNDIASVAVAKDGTYIASGSSFTTGNGTSQFVIRLSKDGKTTSNHTVLQSDKSGAVSAAMTLGPDGNPLLLALVPPDGVSSVYSISYVVKLDADDKITWTAAFQAGYFQYFQGIAVTPDGDAVACGEVATRFQGDALLVKIPVS